MRLNQLTTPTIRGKADQYIPELRKSIIENDEKVRTVINRNDASNATKAMNWFGAPGTLGFDLEYASGTGITTFCEVPIPNTAKVLTSISVKNDDVAPATVNLYVRRIGIDYNFYRISSLNVGAAVCIPYTYIVRGQWFLKGYASGRQIAYTCHYGLEPYDVGPEPYTVSGGCQVGSRLSSLTGAGPFTILDAPAVGKKHIVRTVSLFNVLTYTPTTRLSVKDLATSSLYDKGVYTFAAYGLETYNHIDDGPIVLSSGTSLVLQHSLNPYAFVATVHYMTVNEPGLEY